MSNHPILRDRIKQYTYTAGSSSPITLSDSASGFSTFSSEYSDGDRLFYAMTDGVDFEIGSGIYTSNTLTRNVLKSSNNDNLVVFGDATSRKEVFATYPATHAVIMGSGVGTFGAPSENKLAVWGSSNIANAADDLTWLHAYSYLGIRNDTPAYAIDIGGDGSQQSMVKASGYVVGPTGIHFPANNGNDSSYVGGIQYKHFVQNEITDPHLDAIMALSGVVDQKLGLKNQNAGYFLAGPTAECAPNCSPARPTFRLMTTDDFPQSVRDLLADGATESYVNNISGVLNTKVTDARAYTTAVSGALNTHVTAVSGSLDSRLDSLETTSVSEKNTLTITSNGAGQYAISGVGLSGQLNPDIHLYKGLQYHFNVDAAGHPFWIKTSGVLGSDAAYNDGVLSNNNGSDSATILFEVPTDAPNKLHYICGNHATMSGVIYTASRDSMLPYSSSASVPTSVSQSDSYELGQVYYTDTDLYLFTSGNQWKSIKMGTTYVDDKVSESTNQWSIFVYRNVLDSSSTSATASYGGVIGVNDATLDNGWEARTFANSTSQGGNLADADCPSTANGDPTMTSFAFGSLSTDLATATGSTNGFSNIKKGSYRISLDISLKFESGGTYPLMRKIYISSYSGTKFLATIASTLACTAATNTYYAQLDGLIHFESDTDTDNGFYIYTDDDFGTTNNWFPTAGRLSISRV